MRDRDWATEDGQLIRLTITHFDAFKGLVGYLGAALSEAAKDTPPPADDASAEDGASEEETPPIDAKDLTITLDHNKAHKYNKAEFTNNVGLVKKIDQRGVVVTVQPDQVDVFVNFEDILNEVIKESGSTKGDILEGLGSIAKKFFRDKR